MSAQPTPDGLPATLALSVAAAAQLVALMAGVVLAYALTSLLWQAGGEAVTSAGTVSVLGVRIWLPVIETWVVAGTLGVALAPLWVILALVEGLRRLVRRGHAPRYARNATLLLIVSLTLLVSRLVAFEAPEGPWIVVAIYVQAFGFLEAFRAVAVRWSADRPARTRRASPTDRP